MNAPEDDSIEIRCPSCDNDGTRGDGIRFVQDAIATYRVLGIRDGQLTVDDIPTVERRGNARFECHGEGPDGLWCGETWNVPARLEWFMRWV